MTDPDARSLPDVGESLPDVGESLRGRVTILDPTAEALLDPAARLVRLTARGRAEIERMLRREAALLRRLQIDVPERDLRRTAEVLRVLGDAIGGPAWKRALRRV